MARTRTWSSTSVSNPVIASPAQPVVTPFRSPCRSSGAPQSPRPRLRCVRLSPLNPLRALALTLRLADAQSGAAQATPATCTPANGATTYDYIIVGSGAAGIPLADRLTEAGKTVLLVEKGPPSTGRWGGSMKPKWLEGTNLTRFDVPGLCNQIWHDSVGVACTDTDQMEGCVLGGGTAVNAGLWWKPHPRDWDLNFPDGWKAKDVQAATDRVFSRIPGVSTAPPPPSSP